MLGGYFHLYGLEISIKASRRYHGQENNVSIDEARYEAFNLIHILELQINGHKTRDTEFLSYILSYINKIYNTNVKVF